MRSAKVFTLVSTLVAVATLSACGTSGEPQADSKPRATPKKSDMPYEVDPNTLTADVTAARFGESWPLTVKSGVVNCAKDEHGVAVIFQPASSTADKPVRYALNGYAKGTEVTKLYGLRSIDPIWADNPDVPGTNKDIGVLIDVCKPYM